MRMKVSNYISEMLVKAGIHQAFMVTGGGAMHLDDALGHQAGLHCIYDHHEQACAIAAEAYARIHNQENDDTRHFRTVKEDLWQFRRLNGFVEENCQ